MTSEVRIIKSDITFSFDILIKFCVKQNAEVSE